MRKRSKKVRGTGVSSKGMHGGKRWLEPIEDAGPKTVIFIRLPASLKREINTVSAVSRVSMNTWALRCFRDRVRREAEVLIANFPQTCGSQEQLRKIPGAL